MLDRKVSPEDAANDYIDIFAQPFEGNGTRKVQTPLTTPCPRTRSLNRISGLRFSVWWKKLIPTQSPLHSSIGTYLSDLPTSTSWTQGKDGGQLEFSLSIIYPTAPWHAFNKNSSANVFLLDGIRDGLISILISLNSSYELYKHFSARMWYWSCWGTEGCFKRNRSFQY